MDTKDDRAGIRTVTRFSIELTLSHDSDPETLEVVVFHELQRLIKRTPGTEVMDMWSRHVVVEPGDPLPAPLSSTA